MLNKIVLKILIAAIIFWITLLTLSFSADASEKAISDKPQDTLSFYVAAGVSLRPNWDWEQSNKFSNHPYLPNQFNLPLNESPAFLSARFGFILPDFGKIFAIEWEYNYMKAGFKTEDKTASKIQGISISRNEKISGNFFFVNLLLRSPEGAFHPYLGAGIGTARLQKEAGTMFYSTASEQETQNMQNTSYNAHPYQLFAGIDFDITTEWAVGLRYKITKTGLEDSLGDANLSFRDVFVELKHTW